MPKKENMKKDSSYESPIPRSPQTSQAPHVAPIKYIVLPIPRIIPITRVEDAQRVEDAPRFRTIPIRYIERVEHAPRVAIPRRLPIAPSLLAHGMSNKNRPNSFREEVESNKDKEKGCCCSII